MSKKAAVKKRKKGSVVPKRKALDPKVFQRAVKLFSLGEHSAAVVACRKVLSRSPADVAATELLGVCYQQMGRHEEAVVCFDGVVAAGVAGAQVYNNLAICLAQLKRFGPAFEAVERALRDDPAHLVAHNNACTISTELGGLAVAESHCRAVIGLSSINAEAHLNLAASLRDMGRVNEAVAAFRQYLYVQPGDPFGLINLAVLYFLRGNLAEAEECLGQVSTGELEKIEALDLRIFCRAYKSYVEALLLFRGASSAELYGGAPQGLIYVLGESHALSPSATSVQTPDGLFEVSSRWVVGAKAWHFASDAPNKYKTSLTEAVAGLEVGDRAVFMFGEIDCRMGEGFLVASQKQGADVSEVVRSTVKGYFEFVVHLVGGAGVIPIFYGVPSPSPASRAAHADGEGLQARLDVIDLFNRQLADRCSAAGYVFLDVQAYVAGLPSGEAYIDEVHLLPNTLGRLLAGSSEVG